MMRNWKIRGKRSGVCMEVVLRAADHKNAVEAASRSPHRLIVDEAVLLEASTLAIGRLLSKHGWSGDRILENVATTTYETAVGPKQATARIDFDDAQKKYWLKGEYYSEGNNALSTCYACIPVDADVAAINEHVDEFVLGASQRIADTYAARLLRAA